MWSHVITAVVSLLVGIGIGGVFWRRRAYALHVWWLNNFNHMVNAHVAEFFGGKELPGGGVAIPVKVVPPGEGGEVN
jgi:hypothetical protein